MRKFKAGDIVIISHLGAPVIARCNKWQLLYTHNIVNSGYWEVTYLHPISNIWGFYWTEEYLELIDLSPLEKVIYEIYT